MLPLSVRLATRKLLPVFWLKSRVPLGATVSAMGFAVPVPPSVAALDTDMVVPPL